MGKLRNEEYNNIYKIYKKADFETVILINKLLSLDVENQKSIAIKIKGKTPAEQRQILKSVLL